MEELQGDVGAMACGSCPPVSRSIGTRRRGKRRVPGEPGAEARGSAMSQRGGRGFEWRDKLGGVEVNRARTGRGGKGRSPSKSDAEARAGAGRRRGRCGGDWQGDGEAGMDATQGGVEANWAQSGCGCKGSSPGEPGAEARGRAGRRYGGNGGEWRTPGEPGEVA